ncbi:Increased rDNA silencing protein 4 [Colletotrichum plurivorum]|uniref:Increased rDNA silencing protein 4 n=1 Tax=Colletotrichum plurivorum TaxID=2175906 RepID=A0A8H6N059_9PEZI|nr:Increased rDNA silencing protein 4 [Colletotrichum plurivorum]
MMNTAAHQPGGASDAAAALKGASLAFKNVQPKTKAKPVPPPKPTANASTTTVSRGTTAATTASQRSTTASTTTHRSTSPIQRQHTDTSASTFGRDGTVDLSSPASAAHLTPHTRLDPKSPSYIAATLAASRSASPTPQPHSSPSALTPAQVNQLQQMRHSAQRRSEEDYDDEDGSGLPDTTSIPATGRLISMFESGEDVDPVKRSARPRLRAPTPERELSPARAKAARLGIEERPRTKPKPRSVTPTPVEREEVVTPRQKKLAPKPAKPRPITPTVVEVKAKGDMSPPVLKSPRPPVSPGKNPAAPTKKLQPAAELMPAKILESRSAAQAARVPITQTTKVEAKAPPPAPEPRRSKTKVSQEAPSSPKMIVRAATEVVSPEPNRPSSRAKIRAPTPPLPRGSAKAREPGAEWMSSTVPKSMGLVFGHGHHSHSHDHGHHAHGHDHGPLQESFLPRSEPARPSTADTSSSNDTFVSASSVQTAVPDHSTTPARPIRQIPSRLSTPGRSSVNSSPTRRTPASSSASLPLSHLSDAIMAGSLAAARLTPSNTGNSTLSPPPLPNRVKSPRLRQTLRQPPSKSDDEDEIRKKKHQRATNKHSHAEGARRRWRDEITQRERRRYEALWASNRGLLLASFAPLGLQSEAQQSDAADCVSNMVAREIWRRSRLPAEELAEVWELVDRGRRGMLGRQEFVVGTWLVDQRLRGRKIPNRVSGSVWDSAQGVKVMEPKGRR